MLFNVWNYNPPYLSASDGMMIERLLKSMEESENGIFNKPGVKSKTHAVGSGVCATESEPDTKFLHAATAKQ